MSRTPLKQVGAPGAKRRGMGRIRAMVLIGVHVAFAIHIAIFHSQGRALSPVEPSESMQTLEYGALNAGFIFFVLAILSTLIFGRFFCGWGCHLVALQDLCSLLLKRMGIRPKPFRSRILVWVPLLAALYMFLWPSLLRMLEGRASPKLVSHLTTENFWVTFGSPTIAILTLAICGFIAVVFLGNKGFCTYACPYGGFFGVADKVSPFRIRVTDACNQCGECTAHCSSNVRVHEEVNLHKMVVDPGCMKCLDCVDNCPYQALYYGPGKIKSSAKGSRAKQYDLTWAQEALAVGAFVIGVFAYRGLFEQVPFLLSLAVAGLFSLVTLTTWSLLRDRQARIQRWQLKSKGEWTPHGKVFAALSTAFLVFTGYSLVLQYVAHDAAGDLAIAQSIYDGKANQSIEVAERHAEAAKAGLEWAVRYSLVPVASYHLKLGGIAEFLDDSDGAETQYQRAAELQPDSLGAIVGLARTYERSEKWTDAETYALKWIDLEPNSGRPHFILAKAYSALSKTDEAIREYEWLIAHDPEDADSHTNLAMLLGMTKNYARAERHFKEAISLRPAKKEFVFNYGLMLAENLRVDEAFVQFDKAIKLDREFLPAYLIKLDVAVKHARWPVALATGDAILNKANFHPDAARLWAFAVQAVGEADKTLTKLGEKPGDIYRKAALLRVQGKEKEADAQMNALIKAGYNASAPW